MMSDARRGQFDVVLVWASDRIARSVKHFLDVLDELNRLKIEYVSFRENIDTGGPLGRAIVIIIGAVAELERNLIIERVRAGMRRARLEGQHIGRNPLVLDNAAIQHDRQQGQSLRQIAKGHRVSTATVQRVLRVSARPATPRQNSPEPAPLHSVYKRGHKTRPANPIKSMSRNRPKKRAERYGLMHTGCTWRAGNYTREEKVRETQGRFPLPTERSIESWK